MGRRLRTNKNVPAKGRLRDMADKLWSLAVRYDWDNKCAVCGSSTVEAHHLIPRQWEATRYELMNGISLCARHHQFDPGISPHQNAAGWMEWLAKHQESRCDWYTWTMFEGHHKKFDGIKNASHYCDVICSLHEYVDGEDFRRICGVRFSGWLDEQES